MLKIKGRYRLIMPASKFNAKEKEPLAFYPTALF